MIIAVQPFIGTPRSAKRLINTYRLLRAGLNDTELASLRSGEHQVVLLLLGILLGAPEKARDRPIAPDNTWQYYASYF